MVHDNVIAIVAIAGWFIVGVCCFAIYYSYHAWKAWQDTALKRDMVARGYTAEEIVAVITAERRTASSSALPNVPPAKALKHPAYSP